MTGFPNGPKIALHGDKLTTWAGECNGKLLYREGAGFFVHLHAPGGKFIGEFEIALDQQQKLALTLALVLGEVKP